jgi:Lectin C-type domain
MVAGASGASGASGAGGAGGAGGSAGMVAGAGGAAGSSSGPKACADYAFLPTDCGCFDNAGRANLLCTTSRPWTQAEAQCEFYDMTLVKIESPAENDWILTQARAMTVPAPFVSFWIGGSSIGSPGTWHWPDGAVFWHGGATGTPLKNVYFDWRTNNPQNIGSESCVQMDQDGWHDGDCTSDHSYVCEWQ